ncbi:glycoside hydrolase family 19 protein [Pseudomonas hunanensis]|uniref:glycoside hydrolase family 19 protein n=1 Tax=Pseudomonas hunanensis TaxID=1247546 RepID=UPI0024073A31|nr:glycoside hydrolase family 19 protein [Pseudomonas hunanensis]MDF9756134.1 putative chitinase [Pseudomonas hunanensis]
MCITNTVGTGGSNAPADVRSLQLLLNLNSGQRGFSCALGTDGLWGAGTRSALESFQQIIGSPAGKPVVPGDTTLAALRVGLPGGFGVAKLWLALINASSARITAFHQPLLEVLTRYRIDTPLRIAHFLAQIAHESGCLRYTEELASGSAYEGRKDLGNLQPGDGPRFKGRGLIQLTGRANYRQYGQYCTRDFENKDDPALVSSEPALAVDVAGWFWANRKLNDWADKDDLREVTRRVNGGFNGLDDRAAYLARAKWLLLG